MPTLWLPLIAQGDNRTPLGYALYGDYNSGPRYHAKLREGYRCLNWYARDEDLAFPNHVPYVWGEPVSRFLAQEGELARLAREYPGRHWLLCNEPDYPGQLDEHPAVMVPQVAEWAAAIGDNGIICGYGVTVTGPPGDKADCNAWAKHKGVYWSTWLNTFLALGGLQPAVWHVHIYAKGVAQWLQRYAWWQEWNSAHGNLPTIISETGSTPDVYAYLQNWHDDRVLQVHWYTNFDAMAEPYLPNTPT